MTPPPPGAARVIGLLFRLGLRRWLNRTQSVFRRKKPDAPGARAATPRKGRTGWGWTALFFSIFMAQGAHLSFQFLLKVARHVERIEGDGRLGVTEGTLEVLRSPSAALDPRLGQAPAREDVPWTDRRARGRPDPADGARPWPPEGAPRMVGALAFMLLAMGVGQLLAMLGTANQDLGRAEWSLEWLYTFPAPAGHLFLAKVLEYALVNAYGWIMTAPLLGVFLWAAGYGGWAVPLGIAGTVAFSLGVGSGRVLLETWLRKTFPLNRLKNVQAGFTLAGTLLLMAVFAAAATPTLPRPILDLLTAFPEAAAWNPFSAPALLCSQPLPAAGAMLLSALLIPWAAVRLAQRLVRDGLLMTAGAYQGKRRAAAVPPAGGFRGVVGKDLRLLFRDRNFLVQTLVVPIVVFGFQLVLNPALLRNILSDHRHASAAAYGVGAYVLLCSALHVLTVEGNTLWLLYTFPRDLHGILVRKTVVWCGFGLAYTVALLAAGFAFAPVPDGGAISEAATALAGVGIFAFTVAAIGALATDPLQHEVHRKIRADRVYLAMLLAGLFAYSIYAPSAWQRAVQVVLSALLALALWQKVRDRIPYLLDPTEEPPPRVELADGLVAILAFSVLQALGMALLTQATLPKGPAILGSYVGAGAIVGAMTLYTFWRRKVPRVLHAVGLRSDEGGFARSIGWGLAMGAAAAGFAWVYLRVLEAFEPLRELRDEALELRQGMDADSLGWLAAMAVVAAPLFEEFLFRGLVFRGLRRSWSLLPAVLGSAFLFAIVHPPVAAVPVFVLGACAALALERGRRLFAPILAHAAYNGAVVFLN